ncbi:MAG TPA: transcriptional regulator MntR, partial [Hyphomicrobiales bacterium]|nr:transcriptional regulator MntR [Hyphomicrobiales bacterium]
MAGAKKAQIDPLVAPDLQSESFRQTRQARRLELVEDYVELI